MDPGRDPRAGISFQGRSLPVLLTSFRLHRQSHPYLYSYLWLALPPSLWLVFAMVL